MAATTVMVIEPDQDLQYARLAGAKSSAAIDKLFRHMPDFGDVKMARYPAAVRQQDGNGVVGRGEEA